MIIYTCKSITNLILHIIVFHILNQILNLSGYFQSPKYFEYYYTDIVKLIDLEEQKLNIKEKYKTYFNHKIISLHFRIGDYIKKPNTHPILGHNYYINALTHILTADDNYDILYFSEERDKDQVHNMIKRIKVEFPQLNFIQCSSDIKPIGNNY